MHNEANLVQPDGKHYRVIHSKYPNVNIFYSNDQQNYAVGSIESFTSSRFAMTNANDEQSYNEVSHLLIMQDLYVDEADLRHGSVWGGGYGIIRLSSLWTIFYRSTRGLLLC